MAHAVEVLLALPLVAAVVLVDTLRNGQWRPRQRCCSASRRGGDMWVQPPPAASWSSLTKRWRWFRSVDTTRSQPAATADSKSLTKSRDTSQISWMLRKIRSYPPVGKRPAEHNSEEDV